MDRTDLQVKFFLDDHDQDEQLKRTAAAAYCGAADLGEMLVAARAVTPSDAGSWYGIGKLFDEKTRSVA